MKGEPHLRAKPIEERLKTLRSRGFTREEILRILYLEKYPMFEITRALEMTPDELRRLSEKLKLPLLRCPAGHRFLDDPALHAADAHYCVVCKRWFNKATLTDEIELEIKRLEEKGLKGKNPGGPVRPTPASP